MDGHHISERFLCHFLAQSKQMFIITGRQEPINRLLLNTDSHVDLKTIRLSDEDKASVLQCHILPVKSHL